MGVCLNFGFRHSPGNRSVKFYLIDRQFFRHPQHYLQQVGVAFLVIAGLVAGLGMVTEVVVVAAIGSSAFITFAMPHYPTATARRLIGGHVLCIAVGWLWSVPYAAGVFGNGDAALAMAAGAALASASLLMLITDTAHPPAAGNAIAFAILGMSLPHVLFSVVAVLLLALIRYMLRGWLRNLV